MIAVYLFNIDCILMICDVIFPNGVNDKGKKWQVIVL